MCFFLFLTLLLFLFPFTIAGADGLTDIEMFADNKSAETVPEEEGLSMPEASEKSGVYEDIEYLTVSLSGEGTIYYTTDASLPGTFSHKYSAPLRFTKTTILRAVSVLPDGTRSNVATFSYFINEGHSLPVLSLVNDSHEEYLSLNMSREKDVEISSYLAFYENGEERFGKACGLQVKGNASRSEAKCSLGVYFRKKYDGKITGCDIFGNGVKKYSSLSIRAGQDWNDAIIRSELFQMLCLEMTDKVPTQHTKFCVLYIDGEYAGIYCLKENVNEHFYAAWAGVDSDTVSSVRGPADVGDDVYDILHFAAVSDMSDPKNYEYFCQKFDIDCLIDWAIIEGFSGNSDLMGNVRYFRSPQNDGKFRIALVDLDFAFTDMACVFNNILNGYGTSGIEIKNLLNPLFKNDEFRSRFLTRYASLLDSVLSKEHVLLMIDALAMELDDEIDRNFSAYHIGRKDWEYSVDELRSMANYDVGAYSLSILQDSLLISHDEMKKYFG